MRRTYLDTGRTYEELHRALWTWCSLNTGMAKKDWPEFEENGGTVPAPEFYCFACVLSTHTGTDCCALQWPGNGTCTGSGSQFLAYLHAFTAGDMEKRKAMAEAIAEMEWIES